MSPRTLARILAVGRAVFGAALLVAPRAAARPWIGADADRETVTVLARGLGARDLVLGLMALHTLDRPEVAARWQRTLAACDLVDLGATVAAREALSPAALACSSAVAVGAATGELWVSARLS
jgi:hypothetical protein